MTFALRDLAGTSARSSRKECVFLYYPRKYYLDQSIPIIVYVILKEKKHRSWCKVPIAYCQCPPHSTVGPISSSQSKNKIINQSGATPCACYHILQQKRRAKRALASCSGARLGAKSLEHNDYIMDQSSSLDVKVDDINGYVMYVFTTLPQPHGHWQLQDVTSVEIVQRHKRQESVPSVFLCFL